jgi:hypothetical protein
MKELKETTWEEGELETLLSSAGYTAETYEGPEDVYQHGTVRMGEAEPVLLTLYSEKQVLAVKTGM